MERLRKVLPNIFKTFPELEQQSILDECGLTPAGRRVVSKRPRPDEEDSELASCGPRQLFHHHPDEEDSQLYRSQELLEAYEAARAEWSS